MNASADCLLQVSKVYGRFRWLLTMGKQKCMDASDGYLPWVSKSVWTLQGITDLGLLVLSTQLIFASRRAVLP